MRRMNWGGGLQFADTREDNTREGVVGRGRGVNDSREGRREEDDLGCDGREGKEDELGGAGQLPGHDVQLNWVDQVLYLLYLLMKEKER